MEIAGISRLLAANNEQCIPINILKNSAEHVHLVSPARARARGIDAVLDGAERAGVKLQIGFNRRFDSNHRRVYDLARSGEIGDLQYSQDYQQRPLAAADQIYKGLGGLFLDMLIHDFDTARYISGSDVTEVYAVGTMDCSRRDVPVTEVDGRIPVVIGYAAKRSCKERCLVSVSDLG